MLLALSVIFSVKEFLYVALGNELLHKEPNNKVKIFINLVVLYFYFFSNN
jgi:hypothetical protein